MSSSQPIYCLKCRSRTMSNNVHRVHMANGKNRLAGKCSVCHGATRQILPTGGSFALPGGGIPRH